MAEEGELNNGMTMTSVATADATEKEAGAWEKDDHRTSFWMLTLGREWDMPSVAALLPWCCLSLLSGFEMSTSVDRWRCGSADDADMDGYGDPGELFFDSVVCGIKSVEEERP